MSLTELSVQDDSQDIINIQINYYSFVDWILMDANQPKFCSWIKLRNLQIYLK